MAPHHEYLARLMDKGIKPNAERIAKIWDGSGIAVLLYDEGGEPSPDLDPFVRGLGGAPGVFVFRMSAAARKRMIDNAPDAATVRWLQRQAASRLFVIGSDACGTLLLNFTDGEWSFEPGSLDEDRKAGAS